MVFHTKSHAVISDFFMLASRQFCTALRCLFDVEQKSTIPPQRTSRWSSYYVLKAFDIREIVKSVSISRNEMTFFVLQTSLHLQSSSNQNTVFNGFNDIHADSIHPVKIVTFRDVNLFPINTQIKLDGGHNLEVKMTWSIPKNVSL